MAHLKRNQMNQILFTMVDKTDFGSIESGLTSGFTAQAYLVTHGGSAAASLATLSKAVSVVTSGIYRQTIKAAECNRDYMALRIKHASCADQLMIFQLVDSDDSDMTSQLTVIQSAASDAASAAAQANSRVLLVQSRLSDFDSRMASDVSDILSNLLLTQSMASDAASAAQQANSRVLQNKSSISDIASYLVAMSGVLSDVDSGVNQLQQAEIGAFGSTMSATGNASSIEINGIAHNSQFDGQYVRVLSGSQIQEIRLITGTVLTTSLLEVYPPFNSALASGVQFVIFGGNPYQSHFQSDLRSLIATTGVNLNASVLSDLRSAIAAGPAATITASDISDIASAVYVRFTSDLSDIQSALSNLQSRVPKEVASKSLLSDVNSDLASKIGGITATLSASDLSDIRSAILVGPTTVTLSASDMSDLRSAITAVTATITASDMSDIASRVVVALSDLFSDVKSAVLAGPLDVYSMLSDFYSDFQSRVPKEVASKSLLSDVNSNLLSLLGTTGVALDASVLSDLRSAITAVTATLSASDLSDLRSAILAGPTTVTVSASDMSDLRSAILAAQALTASDMSDIRSAVAAITVTMTASDISDIASAVVVGLSDAISDLKSAIAAGPAATITASDISDMASAVWAHTVGTRVDSRIRLIQSDVSDIESQIDSGVTIGASSMSDLRSAITAGGISASGISDIASAVVVALSDLFSDVKSAVSAGPVSVYSLLSSLNSEFLSRVPKEAASKSLLSDVSSDLRSAMGAVELGASSMSDLRSAITAGGGFSASDLSDIRSAILAGPSDKTGYILAAAGLEAITVETGVNVRQAMAMIMATAIGQVSGAETTTVTIKAGNVPATTRVVATVDADGNRSALTLTIPA